MEFERETRDSGTDATIDQVGPGHPADRRRQFAASLERLAASPGRKVVTCVPAPGHEHDITVGLPGPGGRHPTAEVLDVVDSLLGL